jgi:hypothetical protein
MNRHSQIFGREGVPKLASNAVQMWSVSMGKADKLQKFAEVYSPNEINQAKKFHSEHDDTSTQAVKPIGCAEKVGR